MLAFHDYTALCHLRNFSTDEIGVITKHFSELVGRGSFGTVYKGVVGHTEVAVKVIDPVSVSPLFWY